MESSDTQEIADKLAKSMLWRAKVRVEARTRLWVIARVPSWDRLRDVHIPVEDVPPDIWEIMAPGKLLHAKVNIGADEPWELVFKNWEAE